MEDCVSIVVDVAVQQPGAAGSNAYTRRYKRVELAFTSRQPYSLSLMTKPHPTVIAGARQIAGWAIRSRFVREGKLTLHMPSIRQYVYISGANPKELVRWLAHLPCAGREGGRRPLAPHAGNCNSGQPRPDRGSGMVSSAHAQPGKRPREDPGGRTAATLDPAQSNVVDVVLKGTSCFFTGAAGTGKSLVIQAVLESMSPEDVAITAMTTSAAQLVGGMTLHSFAGCGSESNSKEKMAERAGNYRSMAWNKAKLLIIDEVSMMSAELFDKLEYVARAVRGSGEPFGGLQLLLVGDFFQLPPVRGGHCFKAAAWRRCALEICELTRVFRSEPRLARLLADVRLGRLTAESRQILGDCTANREPPPEGMEATRLCTHRADCDAINAARLAALRGESRILRAVDNGTPSGGNAVGELLDKGCDAPARLELKLGAQVIFSAGSMKGAQGVISRFHGDVPIVRTSSGAELAVHRHAYRVFRDGHCVACRSQFPLALGWALSVHRAQGMSLDYVEVSVAKAFAEGA